MLVPVESKNITTKDRVGIALTAVLVGSLMGAPTSGLLVAPICEFINKGLGRPLGEGGGYVAGFLLSEFGHIATLYKFFLLDEMDRRSGKPLWKMSV